MTTFARYFDDKKLIEIKMNHINDLIIDEKNKEKIANAIYFRLYERFLKTFFFENDIDEEYIILKDGIEFKEKRNLFKTEYKNGFSIMANCCILIETLSAYIDGNNQTPKINSKSFKKVFKKANEYKNSLSVFEKEADFYYAVRCGILHQGETYNKFIIRRSGDLFNKSEKSINATLFLKNLNLFLGSYIEELKDQKWDSEIWDNCRIKLRHIINNS
jgi:hypothetical protein